MSASEKSYSILKILNKHSDEGHPMNATEICRHLSNMGIETDRRTIYRNISGLEEAGYDIIKSGGGGWFLQSEFETVEIKILMDAVQQAHFLTFNKSSELIGKLLGLTSDRIAHELKKQVSISNRSKWDNEAIYYNIDKINTCIMKNKKLTFKYFNYSTKGKRVGRLNDYTYTVNPYFTTWFNENYYLIAATGKHVNFSHYRIERMTELNILEEPRRPISEITPKVKDLAEYLNKSVNMFTGKPESIRLKVNNELANQVFNQFGANINLVPADEDHSYLNTDAVIAPGLISWIISYGDKIQVISPDSLKEKVIEHCKNIQMLYE